MIPSLDAQVPDPAAVAAAEKNQPQTIRILDDADLAAVNGGGNVHAACVRAVGHFLAHEFQRY